MPIYGIDLQVRGTPSPATLQVFHGDGELYYGPNGVDLGNFSVLMVDHPDPEGTTMETMKKWFTRQFSWDPQACSVTVQCLWTRSHDPVVWELKHVCRSSTWVKWLRWCRRHGHDFRMLVRACPREVYDDIADGRPGTELTVSRGFFGDSDCHPSEFWPICRHGDDAVVQDYEHLGDTARLLFRCPYFKTNDCGYKYLVDPRMEPHAQEYIRYLQAVIQELKTTLQQERNNNIRHLRVFNVIKQLQEHMS